MAAHPPPVPPDQRPKVGPKDPGKISVTEGARAEARQTPESGPAASAPHAELPLPLLVVTLDRPNDAATVAIVENLKGPSEASLPSKSGLIASELLHFG